MVRKTVNDGEKVKDDAETTGEPEEVPETVEKNGDDSATEEDGATADEEGNADGEDEKKPEPDEGDADGEDEKKPEADEDGNYEVEQIVDMEVNQRWKCPVRFRVRWVGYGEKDDTHLPADALNCDELVNEFLEISGRNPEFKTAMETKKAEQEAKKAAKESTRETRKRKVDYEDMVSDDEDEYIPMGTSTRKFKPPKPEPKPAKLPKRKKTKAASNEYEVQALVGHRVKGKANEFKVRWKGFSAKHDLWVAESELNCPQMIKKYYKDNIKEEEEESYEVQSIVKMRESKKNGIEYMVRWKGYSAKDDSWLPESELESCPAILNKFKASNSNKKETPKKNNKAKANGKAQKKPSKAAAKSEVPQNTPTRGRNSRVGKNRSYSEFYEQ